MNKNVMKLNLSTIELASIFNEVLKQKCEVSLWYNTEDHIRMGVELFAEIDSVDYTDNSISFMYSNNSIIITVPEETKKSIPCKIVHEQIEEIDFDKLSEGEKQDYLYDNLNESNRNFEKLTINKFDLYFDDFAFEINMGDKEFYGIIGDLEKHTKDFSKHLSEVQSQNEAVNIDGFWESIDNAIEK